MSELINIRDGRAAIRWKLLTSVSAFALASSVSMARPEDADRPTLWIELGGQMATITGQGEVFAPGFLAANPASPVLNSVTPLQAQKPARFSLSEGSALSFQPEDSDWVFSAAVTIGRSGGFRHVDHQTNGSHHLKYKNGVPDAFAPNFTENFADTEVHRRESHTVLDFSAGKDVGLGLFGKNGSSVLSVGARFAQFVSKESFDIRARPDFHLKYQTFGAVGFPSVGINIPQFHNYHATGLAARNFHGIGPSLSWKGWTPFAGTLEDGEATLDWGVNAAVLFGKQKARVQHQETAQYPDPQFVFGYQTYHTLYMHLPHGHNITKSVTVPNVGGFAGLSWRVQDFKVSLGYRADFFFGAMDTGIDAAKKSNLTFNGPYASISVGLGD